MATDGSGTPEQTPPPTGERKGLFGRFRREAKPAAAPQTPPPKESIPGKMNDVIKGLQEKNAELGGSLISEFGKKESRFIALRLGRRAPVPPSTVGDRIFTDYLIVTPDGFKILRVNDGTNSSYGRNENKDIGFNQALETLMTKGNPVYYANHEERKSSEASYPTEGSAYTHSDGVHRLNFGEGPSLEFNQYERDPSVAILENPSMELISYLKEAAKRGHHYPKAVEAMSNLRSGDARLILDPDQREVSEIIRGDIQDTKYWIDRRKQEKLAEEAKILAEAEAKKQKPVEKPKLNIPQLAEHQDSVADAALDVLKNS